MFALDGFGMDADKLPDERLDIFDATDVWSRIAHLRDTFPQGACDRSSVTDVIVSAIHDLRAIFIRESPNRENIKYVTQRRFRRLDKRRDGCSLEDIEQWTARKFPKQSLERVSNL